MSLSEAEVEAIRQISNEEILNVHEVFQGANNRSKWLQTESNRFFIKHYFQHASDLRDRLSVEYNFLEFLNKHHVDNVPQALLLNKDQGFAVYSFIEGTHIEVVSDRFVDEAMCFLKQLNKYRKAPLAQSLPKASEACFSSNEYLKNLQDRLERLKKIEIKDDVDELAVNFVSNTLLPEANRIQEKQGVDFCVDESEHILSPSDFGFHNALLNEQGLSFFDFEYAGWDDPAKLISDFFCQPKVPVAFEYWQKVVSAVLDILPENNRLLERLDSVFEIIRLKWCCIVLNEFLKLGASRRSYAQIDIDLGKKTKQLELSEKMFTRTAPSVVLDRVSLDKVVL